MTKTGRAGAEEAALGLSRWSWVAFLVAVLLALLVGVVWFRITTSVVLAAAPHVTVEHASGATDAPPAAIDRR